MRDRRLSDVAEAVFDHIDADDASWLDAVARALEEQAGEGYGCVASMYGPTETSIGFDTVLGPGIPSGLDARTVFEATTQTAPDHTRRVYRELVIETTRGIDPACERLFQSRVHDWGIRDAICLNAPLGGHTGAAFLISQPRRRRLGMGERRWFDEVAALLRIAVRKRGALGPSITRKHSLHALSLAPAPLPNEEARLRAAGFQPIRELDEDGHRRLVVEPVRLGALALLSARERAAVCALRPETSNKDIAVLLGTTASTVGVLLHRAAAKLRVRSRKELITIAMQASRYA